MNDTVLIVDDSLTVRMDLQEGFEAAGFEVQVCATAAAAHQALQHAPLQVVVLDVLLPDGDGVELLRALRASPLQAGAVVLMLSTEAEVAQRIRGLRTGADEYVGKPYDRHALVARAQELLRRKLGGRDLGRATVLVIDDSATFREELAQALVQDGYAVLRADSGEEGLRLAAAARPSAMIVDGVLPGIDGTTVIRRIRLDAALRGTPCLLLTAAEEADAELRALDAGADAFVRKDETLNVILARLAAVLRSASGSAGEGAAGLLGAKRILAVDDSPTFRNELAATLHAEGYDVVLAHSGEEALEMLAVQPVDCILMDLIMPGLGGQQTCRRIKAAPGLRDIPLIMLTAHDDGDALIDCLGAGADDYIQKSADFVVLQARVRAQIRRKQFEDENRRIREELLHERHEAATARAARELAETRAALVDELERKSRELERATQAKSQFLATMSHEIRTPLNAIIGMAGLLAEAPLSEEQHEFATIIRHSGDHLLTVINDILDFSRLESGQVPLESMPFDVATLVEECLDLVAGRAREKEIELTYELADDVPPTLQGDAGRVRQILVNFLSNAVKFTGRGEVVVSVSTTPAPDGQQALHCAVRDTGIGIAPDRFDRLFKSFSQVDGSIQREFGGTGLGLAICRRLAELMGGRVWAESEPGQGSTFHVCLMADLPAPGTALGTPNHARRGEAVPLAGLRAWVIDDNDTNRRILCRQLRDWGLTVQDSGEPGKALEWAIRGDAADLAVLDFHMPGLNGLQLAQALHSMRGTALKQVLLTSGFPLPEAEARAAGLLAQLSKPVKHAALLNTILRLFERQPAQAPAPATPAVAADPAAPLRILVAEDNAINAQLMIFVLANLMGHRTEVAGNGAEAIEALRRQPFDVILMDVQMPVMDGLAATRLIRQEWPAHSCPRIIALTAGVTPDEEQACRQAGMDDFLVKPLDRDQLALALSRCRRLVDL
ncbi:response regulator [Aquabacterium sp.]|uniref:response regulator n=1 Tax=Aquabacterium sp. TaxID=1872578 RepID=UPI002D04CBAA|nr:response regulator [Aquabacterium sp.]HSW08801.1 response regulator [Aquabacterium sp.]